MSVLLAPKQPLERWSWLSLLAGMAVCEAVRQADGIHPLVWGTKARVGLKWPNDVLVGGHDGDSKKICGVLAQASVPWVVVGFGVNIHQSADQLPYPGATSLDLAGIKTSRSSLAAGILNEFAGFYTDWQAGQLPIERYEWLSWTLGSQVRVAGGDSVFEGVATKIGRDGRIFVEDAAGETRAFDAGDVTHLRSAR
jgi:BirA family biotin operon repressor/biotin-[acetyl-CoA-carboxylase] ligase